MRDWQRQRIAADHDFRGDLNPGARFHMNHVCFDDRGNMLVTLPGMSYREGKSRVYNVTRHEFLFGGRPIPGATRGRVHDGIALGSFYYLCRTASGDFIKLERETGQVVGCVNCSTPLETTTGDPLALEHGWLRGASHLDGEVFLVGQAKLRLFLVDMNSENSKPTTTRDRCRRRPGGSRSGDLLHHQARALTRPAAGVVRSGMTARSTVF